MEKMHFSTIASTAHKVVYSIRLTQQFDVATQVQSRFKCQKTGLRMQETITGAAEQMNSWGARQTCMQNTPH